MNNIVLYQVEIWLETRKRLLHLSNRPSAMAIVPARKSGAFRCRHYVNGEFVEPVYEDIRRVLPPQYRAAFDRINSWWYPATTLHEVTNEPEKLNACHSDLTGSRGQHLGVIYATPYLFNGYQ